MRNQRAVQRKRAGLVGEQRSEGEWRAAIRPAVAPPPPAAQMQAALSALAPGGHAFGQLPLYPPAATSEAAGGAATAVQRSGGGEHASEASADLGARIRSAAGGGGALPAGVQRRLEAGLGADLSGVRLHTDGEADRLSRAVDAVAFTTGPDIFFRAGSYRPDTAGGLRVLAHEAAHVVQQAAGPVAGTPAPGGVAISDPGDAFERAADAAATAAVQRIAAPAAGAPALPRRTVGANRPRFGRGAVARPYVQRVDAYGVKIGETEDVSLIHRVEPAEGTEKDTVRCYLTVFARAEKGTTYKDIHTDDKGKIVFINKTEDTMLNMGDPRRAFHYIRTYTNQKSPAKIPIIRSFDIPRVLYDEVTGASISESQRAKLGRDNPYNVDKERGQNQFGLPPGARDKIESQGKNLISYVEEQYVAELGKDPSNGLVKGMDELLAGQLGMPDAAHRKYLVPMREGHVPSPQQEAAHGGNLTKFYDDLDDLVGAMEGKRGNPLHVYAFQIEPNCHPTSSGYYGAVVAPLVQAEGYLPGRPVEEVKRLREQIGRAATFSVIPQMVTEEYLQANARLHGQARDKNDAELSSWAQAQNYNVVSKPVVPGKGSDAKPKLSEEEKMRLRKEAAERAEEKKKATKSTSKTKDETEYEDIVNISFI